MNLRNLNKKNWDNITDGNTTISICRKCRKPLSMHTILTSNKRGIIVRCPRAQFYWADDSADEYSKE